MSKIGTDAKVYPLLKIALVVDALREAGVSPIEALRGSDVSNEELYSVETRVSLNQVIEVYRNAARLAPNQDFGFSTGLEAHVSTYGAYGFAILSSTDFRQTMRIIVQYHLLATPLVELRFREEKGSGIWIIKPLPHPAVDAYLYRFLVEHQFGVHVSLQRDIMGASFAPSELHVTFAKRAGLQKYAETMGCKVLFDQPENRLIFDGHWLRGTARVGNVITNKIVVSLCDSLLKELELPSGLAGQIRHILLANPGGRYEFGLCWQAAENFRADASATTTAGGHVVSRNRWAAQNPTGNKIPSRHGFVGRGYSICPGISAIALISGRRFAAGRTSRLPNSDGIRARQSTSDMPKPSNAS